MGKINEQGMKDLVDRFLSWPLPKSVASDGCVTNPDYPHPRCGTNLLTADEARQMLEHVLTPLSEQRTPFCVSVPLETAILIRKVCLPHNPNKCRGWDASALQAVREFIALVERPNERSDSSKEKT